jgi:hypothetical protein
LYCEKPIGFAPEYFGSSKGGGSWSRKVQDSKSFVFAIITPHHDQLRPGHSKFLATHFCRDIVFASEYTKIVPSGARGKVRDGIYRLFLSLDGNEDITIFMNGKLLVALHIQLIDQYAE